MLTRRDGLKLTGAALATGAAFGLGACAKGPDTHIWEGEALGAPASIKLRGLSKSKAKQLFKLAVQEIKRLENMFSLYKPESEISRLNRHGKLDNAPDEFVQILKTAHIISKQTGGAFDITVQPLWELAKRMSTKKMTQEAAQALWAEAYSRVDYRKVIIDGKNISFAMGLMAITLNGIAQGAITDAVTDMMMRGGAKSGLINIGEYRAFGSHEWAIDIQHPLNVMDSLETVTLKDRAMASSATGGGYLGQGTSHIFRPNDQDKYEPQFISATVVHKQAAIADALATAFILMDEENVRFTRRMMQADYAVLVREDGEVIHSGRLV